MKQYLFALVFCLLAVNHGSAQDVTLTGEPDDPASAILSGIVERGAYQLIDRDTVLDSDSRITSDVLIVDARVAIEGTIEGAVAVVRADFFIRPGASVAGPIAVIGGGVYPSRLAQIGEIVEMDPDIEAEITSADSVRSIAVSRRPGPGVFRTGPLFGIAPPTYDRVNGLSLTWSAELASAGDTPAVRLRPFATYHVAREAFGGGVELSLRPSSRAQITLQAHRAVRTSDRWIRGDLENSLAAFLSGSDIRDYYESDELAATVARVPPPPLIEGEGFVAPYFTLRASRDRSLETREAWSVTGDDEWRLNPPIDEGVIGSLVAGATAGWRGLFARFSGDLAVEWAPGTIGDFDFAQLRADAAWNMVALYQHQVAVSAHLAIPLGSAEAPLQRWSFVGGPGTLPAHPDAAFRGDHVLFVESVYTAPITRIRLPLVGPPSLRLIHAAGVAWRTGASMPPIEQNLGVGLQLMMFDATLYVDPAAGSFDPTFSLGAQLPISTGGIF